jgi:hypothetical protein
MSTPIIPPQVAQKETCENCQHLADPVHRTADPDTGEPLVKPLLRGWFCPHCGHLTKPLYRERGLEMPS